MQFLRTISSKGKVLYSLLSTKFVLLYTLFKGLKRPYQVGVIALGVGIIILLGFIIGWLTKKPVVPDQGREVRLEQIGILGGTSESVSVVGTVRSVSEARVLAEASGTVRKVHVSLGSQVGAGTVLAELENASERASVLQAEGVYETALASRLITSSQSGNAQVAFEEAKTSARNTYKTAYTTLDTVLETYADSLFAGSAFNPSLTLSVGRDASLERKRTAIAEKMQAWRYALPKAETADPEVLLAEADAVAREVSTFLTELSLVANRSGSGATATELSNVSTARTSTDTLLTTLSTARDAYRAKKTAAEVASQQSGTQNGTVASADASVKQALGALRLAQANLEKTLIRAPISGTVNFLPIRVGDYVTSLMHSATIANNGALEVVSYVSEEDRVALTVNDPVKVEGEYEGVITAIAPALDPVTKQIEIRVAVTSEGTVNLVNGQAVRISFVNATKPVSDAPQGPLLLPLASVKLRTNDRVVFGVTNENTLVAYHVEIGQVRGNRIEVLTPLPSDLLIVTDARGLAEGQAVVPLRVE